MMVGTLRTRAILATSLGGLLFGFDTAVISGVTDALRSNFGLSAIGLGTAVSAALWGTLLGAITTGGPGDRYGSLAVLRVIGVLYVISAIGCAVAPDLTSFALFRFIGGIAIGGSSVLVPVYIAEISPAARRGFLVGLFQFNIVLGILVAYLSNFIVAQSVANDIAWRWKLAVACVPAILFLVLLFGVPQSPRWLKARGRNAEAADAARRLGGEGELDAQVTAQESGRFDWSRHKKPILLAIAIGLFNQLSGINAILYYLGDIFAAAGFERWSADLQSVAIGVANLVATMVAMTIIDRVGRKPLLIGGGVVTAIALAGVGLVYSGAAPATLLLPLLILFIVAFAMSQGAVIWVYLSEIFPTSIRARGQSLGSATHWIANAAISFAFPIIAQGNPATPFWFFAVAMLAQAAIVWRYFPETKRSELEAVAG